jgi:glutamine cyclotransferase
MNGDGRYGKVWGLFRPILFPVLIAVLAAPASLSHPDRTFAGEPSPAASPQAAAAPRPAPGGTRPPTPICNSSIINTYPHDPQAFTQGLVFDDGILYESTGLLGRSSVRKVDLKTGAILQIHRLPAQLFGEGITVFGERLIQLTWQSGVGLVYDKRSFRLLDEFRYHGEGWGLTHDGKRLIMSDGTATLRFLDPDTYGEVGRLTVFDGNGPVAGLNELEYVRGEVYANVWPTSRIVRIDPATGRILAWLDLDTVSRRNAAFNPDAVLNGIAYDPRGDRLFVTGKLWQNLYEIKVVPSGR